MKEPSSEIIPQQLEKHGDIRIDNYYWLKDRDNQDVIKYLEEENAYLSDQMKHTNELQNILFDELKGRLVPDESSAPVLKNGYYYYSKYEEGKEHPVYIRYKVDLEAEKEKMLDVNTLAINYEYYDLGALSVSENNSILCFAEDTLSRRIYTLRFKNLLTGEYYDDVIPGTSGDFEWANDNQTIFYTLRDPQTLRSYKVMKHIIGTPTIIDKEVYTEFDETFMTGLSKSRSKKYIFIENQTTLTTDIWLIDADKPELKPFVFHKRERGHEYHITHQSDRFLILSNWNAKNFRVLTCGLEKRHKESWNEILPHNSKVLIEQIDAFEEYAVISQRKNGLNELLILTNDGKSHNIEFKEEAYTVYLGANPEYKTNRIRIIYSSPTTPTTDFDYLIDSNEFITIKEKQVLGGFDKTKYSSRRLMVPATDGTLIPITLVYNNTLVTEKKPSPLLLYAYGSYGYSMDPYFRIDQLSLLDRGFVFAIAHIRGGQEMGREWYEQGKLLQKKNTFTDFIACAEFLINAKYTNCELLCAMGGSAGGLLMGAVVNMKPDIFIAVVSAVPFVDVVTTMLDETIPLTTFEYDEWGNPNEPEYYNYMLSYSPYDNLKVMDYPAILVTAGLHDSQVQYWEPAKYVAKLRTLKTDKNPLYLYTDMKAGHSGSAGRYQRYKETALIYAFLLDQVKQK